MNFETAKSNVVIPLLHDEMKKNPGGRFRKTLFHIHTPASYDFKLISEKTKKELNIDRDASWKDLSEIELMKVVEFVKISIHQQEPSDFDKFLDNTCYSDRKELLAYLILAHCILKNEIEVCVVTDHNTIKGFNKLEKAINILLKERADYRVITRLELGIEISCADKNHIVGIIDRSNREQKTNLEKWLKENIMTEKDGTIRTSIDVFGMFQKIKAIAYIAHINTSDIFKKDYLSGKYKKELFNNNLFSVIGVTDSNQIDSIKNRVRLYSNQDYCYVLDNDSHFIETLNEKFFYLKADKINFTSLKAALKDYELSICFSKPPEPSQYIKALYVEGNEFIKGKESSYAIINFSKSMNALIGGRGTGKSTLLNILGFVISQYVESKTQLAKILEQGTSCVVYHYNNRDYYIFLHASNQENNKIFVRKYFRYPVTSQDKRMKELRKSAIENRIQVFTYENNTVKIYPRQKTILDKILTSKFSVNDLVNIAGNSDATTKFIADVLSKNKELRFHIPTNYAEGFEGIFKRYEQHEIILQRRKDKVLKLLEPYNRLQEPSLKICYRQIPIEEADFIWYNVFNITYYNREQFFKGYGITYENLISYMQELSSKLGNSIETILAFYKKDYGRIIENKSIVPFFEKETIRTVDKELKVIKSGDDMLELLELIRKHIITESTQNYIKDFLNMFFRNSENFSLYFNINNKESVKTVAPNYSPIEKLSMGQRVVAMLSFLLSYSEFIHDFSPFIVDQPEDNLDNQYIYKNLVKNFRNLKSNRQIILATHNSTILMNSGCEQVIVMDSDSHKGWIETTGYITNPKITNHVVNILEGGKSAFIDKTFLYKDKLAKGIVDSSTIEFQYLVNNNAVIREISESLEEVCSGKDKESLQLILNEIKKLK